MCTHLNEIGRSAIVSRLIMWNLVTLDGFYEGAKSWDLEWHESAWCQELERFSIEQLQGADRLVFGRVTYEGMAAYWSSATGEVAELMNSIPKVVFSRSLESARWANTTLATGDVVAGVSELKLSGDKNTLVFGSGDLSEPLMRHELFDEYRIVVAPVVLGSGKTLFGRGLDELRLRLVEALPVSSGAVILRYEPAGVAAG